MPTIESALGPRSAEFQANRPAMESLVADLRARLAAAALGGGEAARARHLARGKLLPRAARRDAARSGHAVPGVLAARRPEACTTTKLPAPA